MKMMRFFIVITLAGLLMLPGCSKADNGTANAAAKKSYDTMTVPQLTELAGKGDVEAQTVLGATYLGGTGGNKQNIEEGLKWSRLAADKGSVKALFNLGIVYSSGEYGVKLDYKEAFRCFQLSANKGFPDAQFSLGAMYLKGLGVPKNYKEALKWNTLAAEQGFSGAQNNLGSMYHEGMGVPKDFVKAYMWYNLALAAGDGNETAKGNIATLEKDMTRQQIEEAQRLTREWKPKNTK